MATQTTQNEMDELFGGLSDETLAQIDIEASREKYNKLVENMGKEQAEQVWSIFDWVVLL